MTAPYTPAQFAAPVLNPAVGSLGAAPIPYLSLSQYLFAPTAVSVASLIPSGSTEQMNQALADVIRRASSWADEICFGADPASKGASLAASLSVETARVPVLNRHIRLVCDYKPIISVTGIDIGYSMDTLATISSPNRVRVGRRTLYVPVEWTPTGHLTAVWSYVNGYPHTQLAASVTAGTGTCVVTATDGQGGLWGVFPASGAFPGTALTVTDSGQTETVRVTGIQTNTPEPGQTTLTTTPFLYTHTIAAAPDFLPVTTLPDAVQQAVIFLTSALIKTRGARAFVMGQVGKAPSKQDVAEAGGTTDVEHAVRLLQPYRVPSKTKT